MRNDYIFKALSMGLLIVVVGCGSDNAMSQAQSAPVGPPASVAEAEAVLDLETFPLPAGAEVTGHRRLASLSYTVNKPAKEVLEFNVQALTKRGWKELEGSRREGQMSGAEFKHGNFQLHFSLMSGGPSGPVTVRINRQGNVPLTALPMPEGVEQQHAFPAVVMYASDASVEETAKACRTVFEADGWTPYGSAGDTAYYRQGAVLAMVNVMSAPAQGGRTVVSLTSELLSLDLPAPPNVIDLRYDDGTTVLSFDTESTPAEVANFYRETLGPEGWKSTTDEPVVIDWKQFTIFRKPGQEMITIETHDFEGRTRVKVDHQTAAEVGEEELRAKKAVAKRATYRDGEKPEVAMAIPGGTEVVQEESYSLRAWVDRGDAFATGKAVADALAADGWTGDPATEAPVIRAQMLEKGEAQVWVLAAEPRKAKPWIAVVGVGATLKNAKE